MTEEHIRWGGRLWAAADLLTPMAIRVAATLRLADRITAGECTPGQLADSLAVDQDALRRLMNHLVTAAVLTRVDGDGDPSYGLTPLGEQLKDDAPEGVRAWLDLDGAIGRADTSFVQLLHTVRTGEPAFPQQFGHGFWDDLAADPRRSASFDALMGGRLAGDVSLVAAAYPWASLGSVVDVGGGDGTLLIEIARAHPHLRGTVLDLAGPAQRAEQAVAAAGLADRVEVRRGSFFDQLPEGADGYLLSGILHDWDDDHAALIMRRCAEAARGSGVVLVLEEAVGEVERGVAGSEGDLRMLCYVQGRERTLDELVGLGESASLTVGSVTAAGQRSIIEFRSAGASG